jgi:DNA-binding LytR/AlgR family response regulator
MKDIERKLDERHFLRVHRSFIVSLDKIETIESPNIILEDDKRIIPIGGSYKEELVNRINLI